MILPNDERNHDIPREYHLKVINNQVQNMYVFSELRKPDPALKPTSAKAHKAVPTALTGTVHHECTVSPVFNDEYQNIMRKRTLNADRPTKSVKLVNDIFIPAVHQQASFGDYSGAGTKTKRQKLEAKSTRMPREELLDMLFKMFADYEYWSFNGLTEKTNQPKAYLKEVASEIAALQRGGSYNNMYKLKPEYMNKGVTAKPGAAPTTAGGGGSDGPVGSSNASNKTSESADVVIDDDEDFFGEDDDFGNDS
ncbi:hypothetical protein EV182_001456 [Spiromyces aspiralis]|uniref:Uncharacterized protein n=1 Tax=Spiromyces aspiralis TaxID=68401 RepID=A0ACC1HI77_9FUNG|nr:hypothetical protein EV182_001456 [Spiromyces aspiralis]